MPLAGKEYRQDFNLPGFPESDPAVVTVITNPKGGIFTDAPDELQGADYNDFLLSKVIVDWNFADEQGQKVSISPESIKANIGDIGKVFLLTKLGLTDLLSLAKKNK